MVLDAGNSIIKAKIARRERGEVSFPHTLRRLTDRNIQGLLVGPVYLIHLWIIFGLMVNHMWWGKVPKGMGLLLSEMEQPGTRGITTGYSLRPH